ncbi:MAG TPA: cytochrome c oxidase subunit 3 [Bryobacteraceae bacterium]|nr:cytochrome c oxidase subunit 3 [Bryobacteraceae bacterium]
MTFTAEEVARERDLNSLYVLTVTVVLATVTMTFGALILAFLLRSQVSLNWNHVALPRTLWVSTAILLASSATCEFARRRLRHRDQSAFFRLTAVTTALAVLFLASQTTAWLQMISRGILMDRNPHPGFVFIFSGLHAAHILLGTAGFVWLLTRTKEPATGPKYQMNTRVIANAVAIFWHYLDFLWIVLFVLLLTWRQ